MNEIKDENNRSRRKAQLQEFYGKGNNGPLDIDGPNFDVEIFKQKLVKEATLNELFVQESKLVKEIGSLDSQMQTLVYENYNKFIYATNTIYKMRTDFKSMETEMDLLAQKMSSVSSFSSQISETLKERRTQISKLSSTHASLKKIQFLLDLPAKLKECIERIDYDSAVKYYLRALTVLKPYRYLPSFIGIQEDCESIMNALQSELLTKLTNSASSSQELNGSVNILLQLHDDAPETLVDHYLKTATEKCEGILNSYQISTCTTTLEHSDILGFVDLVINGFLTSLFDIVSSYEENFSRLDKNLRHDKLEDFMTEILNKFYSLLKNRLLDSKVTPSETSFMVRALDRLYRRVLALSRLVPFMDSPSVGLYDILCHGARVHCDSIYFKLKDQLSESLVQLRHECLQNSENLKILNNNLLADISNNIIRQLEELTLFLDPDIHFATLKEFRDEFASNYVRQGVLVKYLQEFVVMCSNLCEDYSKPVLLYLLLSRTTWDLKGKKITFLHKSLDELFGISTSTLVIMEINNGFADVSKRLINHYVQFQGQILSQMIRKSVETRDWLKSVEPRSVRSVIKRIVEELNGIDKSVGYLYEDGISKTRSSDSSRRIRFSSRYKAWSSASYDTFNISKMFTEKFDIFAKVDFNKTSILTGIIKIALKTLLESVRLKTFSQFGFQQLQVDTYYLQLYLWKFVSEENLISVLLDEVLISAIQRCLKAVFMEVSVIELICEKN